MVRLKLGYFGVALIAGIMLIAAACNVKTDERSKLLVKRWAYREFKMNGETMTGEQLENPMMEFFADGKYKIEFGVMSEEGQWKIEGNELLTTTSDNKKNNRLKIVELTENKLVLHSEIDENKAYITLTPALQGN